MGVRSQMLTMRLWAAQEKRCSICEGELLREKLADRSGEGWSWDHVWPSAHFDYRERGNILIAHSRCNSDKGARKPTKREREMLAKVNAELGLELRSIEGGRASGRVRDLSRRSDLNRRVWNDGVAGPSVLAIALAEVLPA